MSTTRFLGIDLGTTNSAAALFDGDQVHLVRTSAGGTLTPSVVRLDARGGVTVGARARRFLESDPQNTRGEFKRLMGAEHTIAFAAAKASKSPTELSALVLKSIRKDVEDQFGFAPLRVVIAVPALFELPQSAATSEAARLAGFEKVELLQEPVASAIAAGWNAEEAEARPWLVYDLGGGTFDASLLETQDGMLRVVGHDGDNFLGGRDFDGAIVAHVLAHLRVQGFDVDPADPVHATGLRRLRHLAEDAKIELSRADRAAITLPEAFQLADGPVDVDVDITRDELIAGITPLVDRSIAVCLRLLAAHGVKVGELGKIVLVGGPTVIPSLRERVGQALVAPFAHGLDPMTLVAQGAALFAASAGLTADVAAPASTSAVRLWLQYPTMTSDLTPFLAGRLLDPGEVDAVRVERPAVPEGAGNGWQSSWEMVEPDGTFLIGLDLRVRGSSTFHVTAVKNVPGDKVDPVAVAPCEFTIVHGVTLQDPPLSRTVGIARADDVVHVYFPRGAPLPIRRSFSLTVVETLLAGHETQTLRVPIVQGEFHKAHLCRLVGTLEIGASQLTQNLNVGCEVEVALEMDRGGRLTAQAKLPWGQVFDEVAQLVAPQLAPDAMLDLSNAIRVRLARALGQAVRLLDARAIAAGNDAERLLGEAAALVRLARGGDADASEKARRCIIEADGEVATVEASAAWPEMAVELQTVEDRTRGWVARYGSATERQALDDAIRRARAALEARREAEVCRLQEVMEQLATSAWSRSPGAWTRSFAHLRSCLAEARDLRAAEAAVRRGEDAKSRGDEAALEKVCHELADLMPVSAADRRQAFGSGVR
ncbi:MAG: Hsp70 family protein [Myxococcales bacterium]|nr:Hsp70 family protein [Myxococcales bacterium]